MIGLSRNVQKLDQTHLRISVDSLSETGQNQLYLFHVM